VRAEVVGREPTLALIARWAELAVTQAPLVGSGVGVPHLPVIAALRPLIDGAPP
jgi:hypothetical protein